MSWSPITPQPRSKRGAPRHAPVAVGALAKTARSSPGLVVILRAHLLETTPAWLRLDGSVAAMLGAAEHAGMLRIEPNGPFTLRGTPGNAPDRPVLQLRVPLPADVAPGKQQPVAVEFDYADRWLELTLPGWARAAEPMAAPRAAAAAPAEQPAAAPAMPVAPSPRFTGNATPPARAAQLAAAAAEMARRKAGQ